MYFEIEEFDQLIDNFGKRIYEGFGDRSVQFTFENFPIQMN